MNKGPLITAAVAGLFVVGCGNGSRTLTPDQKAAATQQWNATRAGALASLASDQYKDGNFEKCQQTLEQALRMQPDDANLHLLAGKLAIEQGKLELADRHLSAAKKANPNSAEAEYLSGVVLERWQQFEPARAAYTAAVAKNPNEVAYVMAEAEMYVALNRPNDAIALLQGKLPSFKHSGALRDALGQLLAGQGKLDEAVAMLREASRLVPGDASILEHLAFSLFTANQYAEAADVFDRLLRQNEYEKRADVHAALGRCQAQLRQYATARRSYETATLLAPTVTGYWLGLGKVLSQAGDLSGAERAVRKAISLNPASGEAHCLLGYVRLTQNQLPQSLEAFRQAARIDARDTVSVCMQGYVLARMGQTAEAKFFYTRALDIDPNNALAQRLMKKATLHDQVLTDVSR